MGAWSTSAAHEARDGHRQPSRAKDDSARRPIEAEANRLVETYADTILRVRYTYLRSTQDAEDICQDVLLKALGHAGASTPPSTSARGSSASPSTPRKTF